MVKSERLRLHNICFSENSIEIVRDGTLHVLKGEVIGVAGKNHAGKSTFFGAATGEFPCQSGEIWIDEHRKKINSIIQARKEGIFLIKDESSLIKEFTIKDTMKLNFAFVKNKISYAEYIKKYREILKILKVTESYDMDISKLNFHKRVLVEIAQAFICNVKILIFDNVVSLLSNNARLQFEIIFNMLCRKGISVILIENDAEMIKEYIERLYIMRKGKVVAELDRRELEEELVLALLEGEKFIPNPGKLQRIEEVDFSKVMLEFNHVYSRDKVIKDVSFLLYANETLGIWNRGRHSGQAILDILEGKLKLESGVIKMEGEEFYNVNKNNLKKCSIWVIPEKDKMCSNMDIGENISLSALKRNAYGGVLAKKGEIKFLVNDLCGEYLMDEGYRIFPNQSIPDNILIQKKVSLCRAIAGGARIIIFNNPDLKLDIREKEKFKQDILRTQKKKISQIIISASIDSLYPVCNRILQIDEGRIKGYT